MRSILKGVLFSIIIINLKVYANSNQNPIGECERALGTTSVEDFLDYSSDHLPKDEFSPEEYLVAIKKLHSELKEVVEDVVTSPGSINFRNTLLRITQKLEQIRKIKQEVTLIHSNKMFRSIEITGSEEKARAKKEVESWYKVAVSTDRILQKAKFDVFANRLVLERLRQLEKNRKQMSSFEQKVLDHSKIEVRTLELEVEANPLLAPSNLDYGAIPFDDIRLEHFYPAINESYQRALDNLEKILRNKETPNFQNTILAIQNLDSDYDRVETILHIYQGNHGLAEHKEELSSLVKYQQELSADLQALRFTNESLFERVKYVLNNTNLSSDQRRFTNDMLDAFEASGFMMAPAERAEFLKLKKKLSGLTTDFSNNVTDQLTLENYFVHTEDENEISGLDKDTIQRAVSNARKLGLSGWVFDSEISTLVAIFDYADSDDLRKKYWLKRISRNTHGDKIDNQMIVKEIVRLRHELAKMLGYEHFSQKVLEDRMAKTPERVKGFLRDLLEKVKPRAKEELAELQEYKNQMTGDSSPLKPWQTSYWTRKLKEDKYSFDEQKLKPYFEVNKVLEGAFKLAKRLYGLTFISRPDLPVYNDEVKVFEVVRGSERVGVIYVDLFSRPGIKRSGAWMSAYALQDRLENGERVPPLISINANFTKEAHGPTYLTIDDVTTIFHEFGHGLHGLLSNVNIRSQASPNVYWDAVELPSQFMENFVYERQVLDQFAISSSGEILPDQLLKSLIDSENFGSALQFLGQLKYSLLDIAFYSESGLSPIEDLLAFERQINLETSILLPTGLEKPISASFSHIMSGGYAAGYYSYLWAAVLDKDAYAAFKETGDIYNPELANKFLNFLSVGDSQDPLESYLLFRGKEPSVDHLLRSRKIIP
jgi:peptidyl-dipeptidase Dcp